MISKLAVFALSVVLLAACAPMPAPAPAPATPSPPAAPAPEPASTTPIPIRSFTCAELLGATDDDRASASMFFIGYRAALARTRTLSVNQVEAIEETALATCAATPTMTANKAFAEALAANKR